MCVDTANCGGNCSECQHDTIKRLRARVAEYAPLQPPSESGREVFESVVKNNPDADMRAVPNEWVTNQRAITEEVAKKFEARVDEMEAERDKLRAERDKLRTIRCPDGNPHIWDYGYCKKCRQHAADLIDAALQEGE